MFRKLTYLSCFVLGIGLLLSGPAQALDPDLHGWWRFDEGSGTTAYDFSGNGNDGTLQNGPTWVAGKIGGALQLDGVSQFVDVPNNASLQASNEVTVMAWINAARSSGPGGAGWQGILAKGNSPRSYSFYTTSAGMLHFSVGPGGAYIGAVSTTPVPLNEWAHVCAMVRDGTQYFFINGQPAGTGGSGVVLPGATDTSDVLIGKTAETDREFQGMIDDVRIYMRGLTQDEVDKAMLGEGVPYASGPDPANGGVHADTWVTLSWRAGDFAVSHDVYLGDNFDDVNTATHDSNSFRGNQTLTYYVAGFPGYAYPDGLIPGTTYYWRIDEVNEADPNSPWKGDVWSFSIPPKTAYGPDPANGAEGVDVTAKLTWTAGFGAKLHTVYFGDDFDTVANATAGAAVGTTTYTPSGLKKAKTYYWRVDEFDGTATYKGDVWSFTTEGAVGGANPANGAVDVKPTTLLTWTAGALAASHEVYFGSDPNAVKNATKTSPEYKGSKALGDESYDPGKLQLETSYYWRIDEVNAPNPDSPWKGNVWSFTTGDYYVIDDFEEYTDNDSANQAIWQTWVDGFGVADNGAQVGYLLPPYAEQTIVHGGAQSMPVLYNNTGGVTNSEVSLAMTVQRDWTEEGVANLSLWFRGLPGSVGSFVEAPAGTYTMTGSGADIWGTADQFHFAYKTLSGAGSIQAKVLSVDRTDPWAKAGVMIRETLDAGSKFAAVYITPTAADGTATNGARFQARLDTDIAAVSDSGVATTEQTAIIAPYWVKLERDFAGSFRGYYSSDGTTWVPMSWNPQSIAMTSNVYIGLALTAHNANATCTAKFSNVSTTGTVGPQWADQDVGITSNAPEPLYVAISNAGGQPAIVTNPDPNAATTTTWTQWVIPLQTFADKGINLSNVDKFAIGLGTKGDATAAGGSGTMYFDDIRLDRPSTTP
jgi:Concanavalin A-like lectin/glucanases superfamily